MRIEEANLPTSKPLFLVLELDLFHYQYGKVLNQLEEARYLITGAGSRAFPGERVTLPGVILSNPLVLGVVIL